MRLLPGSLHGDIELRIADITVEQLAQVVREAVSDGRIDWQTLPPPHDIDAERRLIASAAWGWLSDQLMRDVPSAAFYSDANKVFWAAICQVRRSPTYHDVSVPDATAEQWAHCGSALREDEVPLWPAMLVEITKHARRVGLRGPVAAELLTIIQENAWHDLPSLKQAAAIVRELWERRKLLRIFAAASSRLASGAVSSARVRERVVHKLGGIVP